MQPGLFGVAYRMLGSATEAEDLVQDVWLRWQTCDRDAVADSAAFLPTTATRLAINVLRSARVRRETYAGPWLPEPVGIGADPHLGAERGEALNLAALMLLERLAHRVRRLRPAGGVRLPLSADRRHRAGRRGRAAMGTAPLPRREDGRR